jgi:SAM-dependent methyltransferase
LTEVGFDPAWRRIVEMSRAANDAGYGEFVAGWPLSYFCERLKQMDFVGFDHVLDVGCGHGHWLSALATVNRRVTGIDIHQKRVETAQSLIKDLWLDNAEAQLGSALEIPFADATFDALFCYGVFMFLDRDKALKEFSRVLKPGGSIYICTNGRGWWLKLAIERFFSNRDLSRVSWRSFRRGRREGLPTAIDIPDVPALLLRNGFVEPRAAGEGLLTATGVPTALKPHYDAKYFGFDCVIEFMARKLSPAPPVPAIIRRESVDLALRHVEEAAAARVYSFDRDLARYPSDDSEDQVYATNPAAVSLAMTCARGADRDQFLRKAADISAGGTLSREERIRAHITLTQKLFYHHFAVQPMDGTRLLTDPVEAAAFRACRCGNSARFVADILEADGFETRLLGAACHTAAEVLLEGKWRLLDASLYPPGIFPLDEDGTILPTEKILDEPELLDRIASYVNYNSRHIGAFASTYPLAFSKIESYLRCPIFPSVGYFGAELAGKDRAGYIERYRKAVHPHRTFWTPWDRIEVLDREKGPMLPVQQRPEQVLEVNTKDGRVEWTPAKVEGSGSVVYDVYFSRESRGWSYDAVPVGHELTLTGEHIRTAACSFSLSEFPSNEQRFVSIVARLKERLEAFYLPSEEFVIPAPLCSGNAP